MRIKKETVLDAELLRSWMVATCWTCRQLADELGGVTAETVKTWADGRYDPTLANFARLAAVIGVPLDALARGTDQNKRGRQCMAMELHSLDRDVPWEEKRGNHE